MIDVITDELSALDPTNEELYIENAERYKSSWMVWMKNKGIIKWP